MQNPALKFLHSEGLLNKVKLAELERLATQQIQKTLEPGREDCLKVRPDGTVLDGHHRLFILRRRGVDVDSLPRPGWIADAMRKDFYLIDGPWPGRLAVAARPRGGGWLADEIHAWRGAGFDAVVSLLTSDEMAEFDLEEEANHCRSRGLTFYSLPILDRGVPESSLDVSRLVEKLGGELTEGKGVLIHCRQGIGRSSLIATGLLIEAGLNPAEAIERVSSARRVPVPETPEQREWIGSFGAVLERYRSDVDPNYQNATSGGRRT